MDTPLPWIFTSRDHMVDGAPALTMESQCACKFGGIITIVPVEEEAAGEGSGQSETEGN
ncbi:PAAR-like protein [Anaerocolumna jejuensis]|uniref:PAAR-like protein n=1 Tax=Anaerocolumna jejuensis TaxID=259063 RepID=UPI003F7CAEC4